MNEWHALCLVFLVALLLVLHFLDFLERFFVRFRRCMHVMIHL
uniref:Uncharacterized protein n=1 Tax=Arundo donax TaxID=35708 RepID=A0A0A9GJS5_ARUDO